MEIFIGDRASSPSSVTKIDPTKKLEFVVSYQLEMATKARENVFQQILNEQKYF